MSLADRIAVLHNGKFEQVGPPMELYEYPKTKWVGEFIGDFPMNFLPGEVVGEKGVEIGFRPEWSKIGGELKGTVESVEVLGETIYLFCKVGERKVIIESKEMYDVGDEVTFGITKYRRFKDGVLVDKE
ncbi:MAG: TOBE domain-containing protein [Candidatus Aramenus sp.]|nr:TOBE domain-containing protein [Candidatus Aramenus sp.]